MGHASLATEVVALAADGEFLKAEQRCREFQESHPLTLAGWRAGKLAAKFKSLELKAESGTGEKPESGSGEKPESGSGEKPEKKDGGG
jgi:hypothetical protein